MKAQSWPKLVGAVILSLATTVHCQGGISVTPPTNDSRGSGGGPITPECFSEGSVNPSLLDYDYGLLTSVEGPIEICVDGQYESLCDLGWDENDAKALCRQRIGYNSVAEPLYGLGFPQKRYAPRTFNCSEYDYGLRNCRYTIDIDPECNNGAHVAGVRCTQTPRAPPSPPEVQGLCSNVVWYSSAVSCEGISGYDVRLYSPKSEHQNLTRHVGANGTFYIIKDEDRLAMAGSEDSHVQVRVIHSSGVGDWSTGSPLGCDAKPVPTPTPETPNVYFEINGKVYLNNSALPLTDIGEGTSALYCRTDKEECCGVAPNRFGQFYYPSGIQVPIANRQQGFYRNRGDQIIRLNRREGITSPTGTYRCEIPNADDEMVKIYITLTE